MSFNTRCWLMASVFIVATLMLHLVSHGEPVSLGHPLANFPSAIDSWRGQDLPLDQDVLNLIAVDDYVNRFYQNPDQPPVLLYIGYYKSQRTGQTIHSPKNCLPGAGWEPVESGFMDLTAPDGSRARVNSYVIEKGLHRQIVLYWYKSHGRIIASEYWGKIYMVSDALKLNRTDAALVRVITPIVGDEAKARLRAANFAEQVLVNTADLSPR